MNDIDGKLKAILKDLDLEEEKASEDSLKVVIELLKTSLRMSKETNEILRDLLDRQENLSGYRSDSSSYRSGYRKRYNNNGWRNDRY